VNEMMGTIEIRHAIAWRWYPDDMFSTLKLYDERTGNSPNERTTLHSSECTKTLSNYFLLFRFLILFLCFFLSLSPHCTFSDLHPTPEGKGIIN